MSNHSGSKAESSRESRLSRVKSRQTTAYATTVGRPENDNRRSVRLARKTSSAVTMHPPSMLARLVAYSDSDNDTSLSDIIGADMSTEMPLGVASVTLPEISPPQAEGTTDGINSTGHNLIERPNAGVNSAVSIQSVDQTNISSNVSPATSTLPGSKISARVKRFKAIKAIANDPIIRRSNEIHHSAVRNATRTTLRKSKVTHSSRVQSSTSLQVGMSMTESNNSRSSLASSSGSSNRTIKLVNIGPADRSVSASQEFSSDPGWEDILQESTEESDQEQLDYGTRNTLPVQLGQTHTSKGKCPTRPTDKRSEVSTSAPSSGTRESSGQDVASTFQDSSLTTDAPMGNVNRDEDIISTHVPLANASDPPDAPQAVPTRVTAPFSRPMGAKAPSTGADQAQSLSGPSNDNEASGLQFMSDSTPVTRRDFAILSEQLLGALNTLTANPSHLMSRGSGMTQNTVENHDLPAHSDAEDGDDESDDFDNVRPRRKAKKLVQHHTPNYNHFRDLIRSHTRTLMGRKLKNSPFNRVASPAEVAAYDQETGDCCDTNDFRVYIEGLPSEPWNKSCARVFASSFLKKYPEFNNPQVGTQVVAENWLTHFKTLRLTYKNHHSAATQIQDKNRKKRRAERKSQLYQRRYVAACLIKREYAINIPTSLQLLGVDGMSSDESDHEAGRGEATYFIVNKSWRSVEATEYLRILDAWHLRQRYGGEFHASSGAWPHFRSSSLQTSQRPAVRGLPVNFYGTFWLGQRQTFQRNELRPIQAIDLTLPQAITRVAKRYDLTDRRIVRGQAVGLDERD